MKTLMLALLLAAPAVAADLPGFEAVGAPVPLPDDPYREFDFWLGRWKVENFHLREQGWVGSGKAVVQIDRVAGDHAILERWSGALGGQPLNGFSLRAWDPKLEKWRVWLNWHGGKPSGFFPMLGTRNGERLELFPPDAESPRYTFSRAHEDSCQWDQAQLVDGSWQTNWVMRLRREADGRVVDARDGEVMVAPKSAAAFPQTRELDFLIGRWANEEAEVAMRTTSMIEGFGLLQFIDIGKESLLVALGHDARAGGWVGLIASSARPGIVWTKPELGENELRVGELHWRCRESRCRLERGARELELTRQR